MGCGCGSNFSGQKKKCTCGKNAGGNCSCNKSNASGNLENRIKSNRARFSAFKGQSNAKPLVDTKKYGIADEHFFEYNEFGGNSRGAINRHDLNVEF